MPVISEVIGLSGLALEVCLVWRIVLARLVSKYPYFSFYLACVVLRTIGLPAVQWYWVERARPDVYAAYYWNTETAGVLLRCLVVWELFRHTFPSGSVLRRIVSRAFSFIALALLVFILGALWSYQSYARSGSMNLTLDRSFGFAQSILLLTILLMGRHYGVQLGRNLWGVGVAFGAWMSMSTVNYAMLDLTGSFFPYWQFIRPLSFLGLLVAWNWALWRVSSTPYVAEDALPLGARDIWIESWNRTLTSIRKVKPQ